MASVTLERVSRSYGPAVALHPTDLEVREGEFLTLLGPSGCGKTTTLRMVAGFVAPTSRRIRIGGEDVTSVPPNRRQIGMVFQDYALFPHLSVAENIAFALRERRVPRDRIDARVAELLALIHLPEIGDRMPGQLSGGQQQRVALARAIAHPPRVLLMDEPLSALDLKMREAMQIELRRIQQALGITTIFVTHDQAEAMTLSDTIAVMSQGRVVQRGTAQAIYDRPVNRFVAAFVGQVNLLDGTVLGKADGCTVLAAAGIDGTSIRLRATAGPYRPGPVSIGVRPHHVQFGDGSNRLPGTVLSTSFAGNLVRTLVRAGEAEFIVEQRPGAPIPADGAAVTLAWAPEHTMVLME